MTDGEARTDGPLDGDWTLSSYDRAGLVPADPEMPVTALIRGGRIAGRSACNQYSAACRVAGATIEISQAISTRMACLEPVMELETAYLANLVRATTYVRVDHVLTFLDDTSRPVLVFTAGLGRPDQAAAPG